MTRAGAGIVMLLATAAVAIGRALIHNRSTCGMCHAVDVITGRS